MARLQGQRRAAAYRPLPHLLLLPLRQQLPRQPRRRRQPARLRQQGRADGFPAAGAAACGS